MVFGALVELFGLNQTRSASNLNKSSCSNFLCQHVIFIISRLRTALGIRLESEADVRQSLGYFRFVPNADLTLPDSRSPDFMTR